MNKNERKKDVEKGLCSTIGGTLFVGLILIPSFAFIAFMTLILI